MPDPRPVTGVFGKVPAHGDFVRRGLPTSFVAPWDAWLQAGISRSRESLGANWAAAWDQAPAWRFSLPAGACGPDPVAGVMLPSEDQVGRRFPITLVALLPPGMAPPDAAWFDAVEAAAFAGRHGQANADALAEAVPLPGAPLPPARFRTLPTAFAPAAPAEQPASFVLSGEPTVPGEAGDVLDLGAAAAPLPLDAPGRDDPLGLFTAAPASAPAADSAADPPADDVLALLAGTTPMPARDEAEPPADVLSLFSEAPPPGDESAAPPAPQADDGLLALIAGGTGPAPPGSDAPASPAEDRVPSDVAAEDAASPAAPGPGGLPEDWDVALPGEGSTASVPEQPAPPSGASVAEAPPGPEGGGWWTRGAPHVPPMVWALPALPSSDEFAYLLEAAA